MTDTKKLWMDTLNRAMQWGAKQENLLKLINKAKEKKRDLLNEANILEEIIQKAQNAEMDLR